MLLFVLVQPRTKRPRLDPEDDNELVPDVEMCTTALTTRLFFKMGTSLGNKKTCHVAVGAGGRLKKGEVTIIPLEAIAGTDDMPVVSLKPLKSGPLVFKSFVGDALEIVKDVVYWEGQQEQWMLRSLCLADVSQECIGQLLHDMVDVGAYCGKHSSLGYTCSPSDVALLQMDTCKRSEKEHAGNRQLYPRG